MDLARAIGPILRLVTNSFNLRNDAEVTKTIHNRQENAIPESQKYNKQQIALGYNARSSNKQPRQSMEHECFARSNNLAENLGRTNHMAPTISMPLTGGNGMPFKRKSQESSTYTALINWKSSVGAGVWGMVGAGVNPSSRASQKNVGAGVGAEVGGGGGGGMHCSMGSVTFRTRPLALQGFREAVSKTAICDVNGSSKLGQVSNGTTSCIESSNGITHLQMARRRSVSEFTS